MTDTTEKELDLIWGAEAIGQVIGQNAQQTFHMLNAGLIPARKVGKKWVIERSKLVRFFKEGEAA